MRSLDWEDVQYLASIGVMMCNYLSRFCTCPSSSESTWQLPQIWSVTWEGSNHMHSLKLLSISLHTLHPSNYTWVAAMTHKLLNYVNMYHGSNVLLRKLLDNVLTFHESLPLALGLHQVWLSVPHYLHWDNNLCLVCTPAYAALSWAQHLIHAPCSPQIPFPVGWVKKTKPPYMCVL